MLLDIRATTLTERDQLEQLALDLAEMYRAGERQLLGKMAAQVRRGLKEHPEDVVRALSLSELRTAAQDLVAQLSALVPAELERVMERASRLGASAALTEVAAITGAASVAAPAVISNAATIALAAGMQSRLDDVHQRILRWPDDVYRRAVGISAAQVPLGTGTTLTAQRAAWQSLTTQGVTGFRDVSGRQWNLGTYVEMATRTATRRAWDVQHTETMAAAGVELCTIVVGNGACKPCSDAGGKIWRLGPGPTGRVKVRSMLEDKDVTVTIAGTVDDLTSHGWRHPNCRCRKVAYLPGATLVTDVSTYDPQAEADRSRLRALEREVRRHKQDAQLAVSPSAKTHAQERVRELQRQIREHVKETGLARQPHREQINLGHRRR